MKGTAFITLLALAAMIEFKWMLSSKEAFCFEENLPEKLLVNGYIESIKNSSIGLQIISPKKEDVFKELANQRFRFSFATFDSGNYRFCIQNNVNELQKIKLRLDLGVEAKNYTSYTSKPDLRELDFDVKKLEDMTKQLHDDLIFLYQKASIIANVNSGTSSKIIFFGIFTIAMLVISTVMQVWSIRRFFIQKKIA
jgi:p24 family protein delta-1